MMPLPPLEKYHATAACLGLLVALLLLAPACSGEAAEEQPAATGVDAPADSGLVPGLELTVADLLAAEDHFSTLAAALDSTALTATLQSAGPFTVFAPPNQVLSATGGLLAPERRDELRNLLKHHVVRGRLTLDELRSRAAVETLLGDSLQIRIDSSATGEGRLLIGGAPVEEADVQARNGLIHVVGAVLTPEP